MARDTGEGFVALSRSAGGAVEVYGESPSRPLFSAEFDLAPQRATMLALSELRLAADTAPKTLEEMLPKPAVNPVENDISRNALPYATALSGACPRFAPAANVLPPEYRRFNSRAVFIPTVVLAALLLLVAGSMAVYASWSEKQYLKQVNAEIAKLEPLHRRADSLDKETAPHPRPRATARPVSQTDPHGSRRAERIDAPAGTARLEQQHRPGARHRAHRRRDAADRAAVEDSGRVSVL